MGGCKRTSDKGATITLFWLCGRLRDLWVDPRPFVPQPPCWVVKTRQKGIPRCIYLFRTCQLGGGRSRRSPVSRQMVLDACLCGHAEFYARYLASQRPSYPTRSRKPLGISTSSFRITQRLRTIRSREIYGAGGLLDAVKFPLRFARLNSYDVEGMRERVSGYGKWKIGTVKGKRRICEVEKVERTWEKLEMKCPISNF